METSEKIDLIAVAIVKAQGDIKKASKDKNNPFHHSKYADLAGVWDACREALSSNKLAVLQPLKNLGDGKMALETVLLHESTQWIKSEIILNPVKNDPQAMGSAITYARRQALSALVGVCPEDDDGNGGSGLNESGENKTRKPTQTRTTGKAPHQDATDSLAEVFISYRNRLEEASKSHEQHFKNAWIKYSKEVKAYSHLERYGDYFKAFVVFKNELKKKIDNQPPSAPENNVPGMGPEEANEYLGEGAPPIMGEGGNHA